MKKYYVSGEYLNKALLDDIQVNHVPTACKQYV